MCGSSPLGTELGGIWPPPAPEALLARVRVPVLGSPNAPVAIPKFSNLSCPFCARFALDVLPKLRREFIEKGVVRLYFFPFPVHGEEARREAEAGLCAAPRLAVPLRDSGPAPLGSSA